MLGGYRDVELDRRHPFANALGVFWKGGAHTQLAMERPRSAAETATPVEALEMIRRMAVRYGDDQIASVLNRRGHSTGKGKRWTQTRVATARRNNSIAGQKRALPDPERVSLSEAGRICGVSHRTIQRLVEAGLLKREQVTPRAPWEIRRSDLDAEPIRSIIERLHHTGKLARVHVLNHALAQRVIVSVLMENSCLG